jgi:hypothetical protein
MYFFCFFLFSENRIDFYSSILLGYYCNAICIHLFPSNLKPDVSKDIYHFTAKHLFPSILKDLDRLLCFLLDFTLLVRSISITVACQNLQRHLIGYSDFIFWNTVIQYSHLRACLLIFYMTHRT